MRVLNVRNVHEALPYAMEILDHLGVRRESRNGIVLQHPGPVSTVYQQPCERVLFHEWRNANPFFHFYESLWMLAGRRDVAPLTRYVKRMSTFSDDGLIFNAAYGYRWRHATKLNIDQLDVIISNLKKNPDSRREVLQIWAAKHDLDIQSKDIACNLVATFQINDNGHLDMVVTCRSNDIIWGCYGANAVHFSFLLEYVARCIGVEVGVYTHISVNWHAYETIFNDLNRQRVVTEHSRNPYDMDLAGPILTTCQEDWDQDVQEFVTRDGKAHHKKYRDPFFNETALAIVAAHDVYKDRTDIERYGIAINILKACNAKDWRIACWEWLERRRLLEISTP